MTVPLGHVLPATLRRSHLNALPNPYSQKRVTKLAKPMQSMTKQAATADTPSRKLLESHTGLRAGAGAQGRRNGCPALFGYCGCDEKMRAPTLSAQLGSDRAESPMESRHAPLHLLPDFGHEVHAEEHVDRSYRERRRRQAEDRAKLGVDSHVHYLGVVAPAVRDSLCVPWNIKGNICLGCTSG